MTDRKWYYEIDGSPYGPLSVEETGERIIAGLIKKDTPLWSGSADTRAPASTIKVFEVYFVRAASLPELPEPDPFQSPPSQRWIGAGEPDSPPMLGTASESVSSVRPWPRFLAKMVDYHILLVLLSILYIIQFSEPLAEPSRVQIFLWPLTGLVLVFVEPYFLSTWGKTPGKYLFGITVRNADGSLLSYNAAADRCIKVWSRGLAFNIIFASWVALLLAYRRLNAEGVTSWDKEGRFVVDHKEYSIYIPAALLTIYGIINVLGVFAYIGDTR